MDLDLDDLNLWISQQKYPPNQFEERWILRQNGTGRLVFLAKLIHENLKNADASVRGTLVYQRKSPKSKWEDVDGIALSSLKAGEGVVAVALSLSGLTVQ